MTGAADSILGGGAMARSWSSYLAVMCHKPSGYFQIPWGPFQLDFVAAGATIVITIVLVSGSLNTAWVNGGMLYSRQGCIEEMQSGGMLSLHGIQLHGSGMLQRLLSFRMLRWLRGCKGLGRPTIVHQGQGFRDP